MSCVHTSIGGTPAILEVAPTFKPGDMPPTTGSYLDWHEWARVQEAAGIKQVECVSCGRFKTPQK